MGPGWGPTGDLTVVASPGPAESPASARPNLSLNWATAVKYLQSQNIPDNEISPVTNSLDNQISPVTNSLDNQISQVTKHPR